MIEPGRSRNLQRQQPYLTRAVWPFLRWAGGKRWLVPHLQKLIADVEWQLYIEPFLGGGAVFFGLRPQRALLGDVNHELAAAYRAVRDSPELLIAGLKKLPVDEPTYSKLAQQNPTARLDRAIRLIYLNRTAFSGIYRVNRNGAYNVPYGGGDRTPEFLWQSGLLERASEALHGARMVAWDFERTLARASKGALAYCDPTYTVITNRDRFRRYHHPIFSWEDQQRLHAAVIAARDRGALVLVSNANDPEIRRLYAGSIGLEVERRSTVSRNASKRCVTQELVIAIAPSAIREKILASAPSAFVLD